MALKIQVFYNQGAQGWTETYYSTSTTQPRPYIQALDTNILYQLVAFRHQSTSLYGVRVSTIGASRVSSSFVFSGNSGMNGAPLAGPVFGGAPAENADVTSTDAFCALYTAAGSRRPLFVRGLNDLDITRNPQNIDVMGQNLNAGLVKMLGALIQFQWCIQTQNRPPNNGLVWNQVSLVQANGDSTILTSPNALPAITPGITQVVFQGVPHDDLPGFPRVALVTVATAGTPSTIQIPYRMRWAGPGSYAPAKLKYTIVSYTYTPIFSIAFERFGERKTGRAFGVPRGRSRAVIRAL